MRILGIDPGTIIMGYGIIATDGDNAVLVEYGALKSPQRSPIGERLSFLYHRLMEIIAASKPDVVAVEQPFVMMRNMKSALAIGRAQAIALLAGANSGLRAYEYTPTQVKQVVADYGAGSKEQIQQMVRMQLGLEAVPEPADASDALAVAICHLRQSHLADLLKQQVEE